MRSNYWTCSKFADWLRGTPKITMGTSEEWEEWTDKAIAKSKVRYWLADEGLRILQDAFMYIPDKLYSIKYYFNNRFITRTHALTAHPRDIKPGSWRDVGDRFLPCLFNELQDFVEVELAWWHLAWNGEERAKYKAPWYNFGWFRIRGWRCKQAGLDNLEWQRNLRWTADEVREGSPSLGQLTPQAVKAQEILDLYTWWTEVRPVRPDPHEASGWTALCNARRERRAAEGKRESFMAAMNDRTPAEKKASKKALALCNKIEASYEKEDEDMLIRLIKVRRGLWT
jgi:hypothetical protein